MSPGDAVSGKLTLYVGREPRSRDTFSSIYFFPALTFAHLARCAAAIRFRPAADILCLGLAAFVCFLPVCSSNRRM